VEDQKVSLLVLSPCGCCESELGVGDEEGGSAIEYFGNFHLCVRVQAEIKADPNLSEDDREDALEQVKDLAEAAKNPNDAEMKNKAKKADRMLGRIISAVPQATKLLEFCNNLLPLITKVFGF
jgi:hypothetical protein